MRGEIPTFKRCCFCLPLRRGLLFWGYLKMAISVLSLANILWELIPSAVEISSYITWLIVVLYLVELSTDIGLNIMFIVAAHTKNIKLIRVYYYYMIVLTALYLFFSAAAFFNILWNLVVYNKLNGLRWKLIVFAIGFIYFVFEVYVILLVKSELKKLGQNSQFRFYNNVAEAEAQCQLDMSQGYADAANENGPNEAK